MFLEKVPSRARTPLEEAGITTAVAAISAGMDGLTAIPGIGDSTAETILSVAQAEITGGNGDVSTGDPVEDVADTVEVPDAPAPADSHPTYPPRPQRVVMRLENAPSAIINGRVIYKGEVREVLYAHYEIAVRQYPSGTWSVRFHRDGEFEAA